MVKNMVNAARLLDDYLSFNLQKKINLHYEEL